MDCVKIFGNHSVKLNPYTKQIQKQQELKQKLDPKADQLQISDAAKKMQIDNNIHPAREERVEQLKQKVESGQYKVDADAVAKKMLQTFRP